MVPDTFRWKTSPDYDFMDELSVGDLAWECLRRNESCQTDYSDLLSTAQADQPLPQALRQRWGLRFRRPPKSQWP